jgi:hypothetical protein
MDEIPITVVELIEEFRATRAGGFGLRIYEDRR